MPPRHIINVHSVPQKVSELVSRATGLIIPPGKKWGEGWDSSQVDNILDRQNNLQISAEI